MLEEFLIGCTCLKMRIVGLLLFHLFLDLVGRSDFARVRRLLVREVLLLTLASEAGRRPRRIHRC